MVVCHLLLQADGEGPYPHLLRRLLRHTDVTNPKLIHRTRRSHRDRGLWGTDIAVVVSDIAAPGRTQIALSHQPYIRLWFTTVPPALTQRPFCGTHTAASVGRPSQLVNNRTSAADLGAAVDRLVVKARSCHADHPAPLTGRKPVSARNDRRDDVFRCQSGTTPFCHSSSMVTDHFSFEMGRSASRTHTKPAPAHRRHCTHGLELPAPDPDQRELDPMASTKLSQDARPFQKLHRHCFLTQVSTLAPRGHG
jgi:hypothetical protein